MCCNSASLESNWLTRPAWRVPNGSAGSYSSQSSRGQFQIGNACVSAPGIGRVGITRFWRPDDLYREPRRKRSTGLPTACACSLAQGLCLLGSDWANPRQAGLPVPLKLATNHSLVSSLPRWLSLTRFFSSSDVTSQPTLATSRWTSTRYTVKTEFAVTHSKQTTEAFSTRYKKPPPGGGIYFATATRLSPQRWERGGTSER